VIVLRPVLSNFLLFFLEMRHFICTFAAKSAALLTEYRRKSRKTDVYT